MTDPEPIARIRISLEDIRPEIWRRVEVPLALSLKGLHDVIQAAMGWLDYHLFEFQVGDRRYGIPDPDWGDRDVRNAKNTKLQAVVDKGVDIFLYTYDFGDRWVHYVDIEAVTPADPGLKYPRYIDGARHAPPEDVGGVPGYEEFLDAITKPRHPEHRTLSQWYQNLYKRPFDPDKVSDLAIKIRIGDIAKRRHAGIEAYRNRKSNQ